MKRPRVLFCITVQGGRREVERCLKSASHLSRESAEMDVLVVDDASPGEVSGLVAVHGFHYYRSPRKLGRARSINLGLLAAIKYGYDYVATSSDNVVFPANLLTGMLQAAQNAQIGSVTAWSNLELEGSPLDQEMVNWISAGLALRFTDTVVGVPAASSSCMLMPTSVAKRVGLMDPVFGSGAEIDWSLRSSAAGYRVCIARGVFIYQEPTAKDSAEEALLAIRYPQLPGLLDLKDEDAVLHIIDAAARQFGYYVEVGWLARAVPDEARVRAHLMPSDLPEAEIKLSFRGFHAVAKSELTSVAATLRQRFGRDPEEVNMLERGAVADRIRSAFDPSLICEKRNYPSRL